MTLHTFGPGEVGKKFHVEYPTLKHVENSLRGSRRAKRRGYKTNDLDLLPDEVLVQAIKHYRVGSLPEILIAGHIWNTHWPDPFRHDGFRDPKRILGRGDHMHEMHPNEIGRLVAGHRPVLYKIPTVEQQFKLCAEIHLQALIEPKRSPVWMRPEVWRYLAKQAEHYGTHVGVYSLMHDCLPVARRAGFKAWAIH
jgi:hypothetical protein